MNVLLITLDTLRQDRLGCYGFDGNISPNIDEIARKGIKFENCISASNCTDPSHWSILTGLYPSRHGILKNGWKLKKSVSSIAEIFKKNGYKTGAAVSVEHLDKRFGWGKGFDFFSNTNPKIYYFIEKHFHYLNYPLRKTKIFNGHSREGQRTVKKAIGWLKNNSDKKFFFWLHLFDVHYPYNPSYESGVETVDKMVGKLFRFLEGKKILQNTHLVLVSDHGEDLSIQGHNTSLHDQIIKVPLIIFPKKDINIVKKQVRTIDIFPTLLELAKIKQRHTDGKSLLSLMVGKKVDFPETAISEGVFINKGLQKSIRTNQWKYITNPNNPKTKEEFYDLKKDSLEKENLADQELDEMKKLKKELFQWLEKYSETTHQKVSPETERMLKGLGYL